MVYPPDAQRRGIQGIVDLSFNIDNEGRVRQLRLTSSGDGSLDVAAKDYVQALQYQLPSDWQARGYADLRFDIELQFSLAEAGKRCPAGTDPHLPQAEVVTICSARLPPHRGPGLAPD